MNSYKDLAKKYFKDNKKRNIFTIICTCLVVICIYSVLNMCFNWVKSCRKSIRELGDYEILVFTEDKDIVEDIVNADWVESAYLGKYIDPQKGDLESIASQALHINVKSKYLMKYYRNKIKKDYNVSAELNYELAWTYGQDFTNLNNLELFLYIFLSYILAIIGVAYIRNSLQLSAIERIKDYGNLRCIGATKKEIRQIIKKEAFIVEFYGIIFGSILGFVISSFLSYQKGYGFYFNILPLIIVSLEFYFDLHFIVNERMKGIINVSPVDALRGNIKIKKKKFFNLDKLKRRKSGIWGLLFGIEGDYAYKNIKRNNKRSIRTVIAMSFSIAVIVLISGIISMFLKVISQDFSRYGYYQDQIVSFSNDLTLERRRADLPSDEIVKRIVKYFSVKELKASYYDEIYYLNPYSFYNKLNDDFLPKSYINRYFIDEDTKDAEYEINDERREHNKSFRDSYSVTLIGYDDEDISRNKDNVIEGSLDLSENGIIIVNQLLREDEDSLEEDTLYTSYDYCDVFDYKIGDEIEIVDPFKLNKRLDEIYLKYPDFCDMDYFEKYKIKADAINQLRNEGAVKKLKVECIITTDKNVFDDFGFRFITKKDNYLNLFSYSENEISGFNLRFDEGIFDFSNNGIDNNSSYYRNLNSGYISSCKDWIDGLLSFLKFSAIIICFVIISSINSVILTRSNLKLRVNEFAQLRAIGMTKKSLYKVAVIEGFILWLRSAFLGIIFGIIAEIYFLMNLVEYVIRVDMIINWPVIISCLLLSAFVLIVTNYTYIKNMRMDVARELSCDSI